MTAETSDARFVKPGFHAGGLLHHDTPTAITELAHLGFGVVAISPSASTLHPSRDDFAKRWSAILTAAVRQHVSLVIDLDAPFVHDPYRRDGPMVASEQDEESCLAQDWIAQWVEIADRAGRCVAAVTFATGSIGSSQEETKDGELEFVGRRLAALGDRVAGSSTPMAIRPVAGHAIETVSDWLALANVGPESPPMGLAADVGEMISGGEIPIVDRMLSAGDDLAIVYICDRSGTHGQGLEFDRPIGSGEVSLERIVRSLGRGGYAGPAIYRVAGHADDGLRNAQMAMANYDAIA